MRERKRVGANGRKTKKEKNVHPNFLAISVAEKIKKIIIKDKK